MECDSAASPNPVPVPEPGASVQEVLEFARTYNAYEHLADDPGELERLLGGLYGEISRSMTIPGWVRLDLARARSLFYAYRIDYFAGASGPYEPMFELVDRIRVLSGGSVADRRSATSSMPDRSLASTGSAAIGGFIDSWEYSDDRLYRWWYERRWSAGPSLCFVGLNPATGDTDGKPRPTLAKVVGWAKREGCGAVVVVNLFAFRATKPSALFRAGADIVGPGNDEVIQEHSASSRITLAAWGAHRLARPRAEEVVPLLRSPHCVGVTKSGAPAHPLYVPSALTAPSLPLTNYIVVRSGTWNARLIHSAASIPGALLPPRACGRCR